MCFEKSHLPADLGIPKPPNALLAISLPSRIDAHCGKVKSGKFGCLSL